MTSSEQVVFKTLTPGTLFLIPAPLGDCSLKEILPAAVIQQIHDLDYFLSEHPKTSRAFFKQLQLTRPLSDLTIESIDSKTSEHHLLNLLQPVLAGRNVGVLSEAGCPAVADPGAVVVKLAHALGIPVKPLVGPSSILLGLMASGLNGQQFCFHGYLPVDQTARRQAIVTLETQSRQHQQTQIFIETPYRNSVLYESLLASLQPETRLCLARGLTTADEWVRTKTIREWQQVASAALAKIPTIFLFLV